MSIRSFACQLAVRLAVVAALLTGAGLAAHAATHWEPTYAGGEGAGQPVPSTAG